MADSYVCSGAVMRCSCGTSQAKLTVLPIRTVFLTGQPMANISDHLSFVNLGAFGRCRSLGFPATASATAAAHGKLTPMPCMHNTPFPWMGGKNDYIIKGDPALLKSSTCQCVWGGTISIVNDGQTNTGTADLNKESAFKSPMDISPITLRIRIFFSLNSHSSKEIYYKKDDPIIPPGVHNEVQKVYNLDLRPNDEAQQMQELERRIKRFVKTYYYYHKYDIALYIYGYHYYATEVEQNQVKNLYEQYIKSIDYLPAVTKEKKHVIFRGYKHQHLGEKRKEIFTITKEAYKKTYPNMNDSDILSEIRCINLDQPVDILNINEFADQYAQIEIYQYPYDPANRGSFYTVKDKNGNIPSQEDLGIASKPRRMLKRYKLDVKKMKNEINRYEGKIIVSTSSKAFDRWSNNTDIGNGISSGEGMFSEGGGRQIKIPTCLYKYLIET